jgi:DNA-binding CsgD family transcriptional regulator
MTEPSSKVTGRPEPPDGAHAVECVLRALLALLKPAGGPRGADTVVGEISLDGRVYTITRSAPAIPCDEPVPLSAREREIAGLIARGYTINMVALMLGISAWTVRTHVRRIYAKLEVRSRGAMVARLVDAGVIRYDPRSPDWAAIFGSRPA